MIIHQEHENALSAWLLLLLTVVSAGVIALDMKSDYLNGLRDKTLIYYHIPLRTTLRFPFEFWEAHRREREAREDILTKNKALSQENNWLKAQLQVLSSLEAENRRLRQLMDATLQTTDLMLIAELTDAVSDSVQQSIEINKGSEQGVYLGQPVIDQNGLIGQVVQVFSTRAQVMLITDVRSRVPVFVERTLQRSVVAGSGFGRHAELMYLPLDADIQVGDRLVSSGLGGVFPRGYPVAIVEKVERLPTQSFARVGLKVVAALDQLLEVLLIDTQAVTPLEYPSLLPAITGDEPSKTGSADEF